MEFRASQLLDGTPAGMPSSHRQRSIHFLEQTRRLCDQDSVRLPRHFIELPLRRVAAKRITYRHALPEL